MGSKYDCFLDFDFVGDSHLVRLQNFIGFNPTGNPYPRQLSCARSGARTRKICNMVASSRRSFKKVIVSCGTNDLLDLCKSYNLSTFDKWWSLLRAELTSLRDEFRYTSDIVIWITVPPCPRYSEPFCQDKAVQELCFKGRKKINRFIRRYNSEFLVIESGIIFKTNRKIDFSCFEFWMGPNDCLRIDLIHLNSTGMERLIEQLVVGVNLFRTEPKLLSSVEESFSANEEVLT